MKDDDDKREQEQEQELLNDELGHRHEHDDALNNNNNNKEEEEEDEDMDENEEGKQQEEEDQNFSLDNDHEEEENSDDDNYEPRVFCAPYHPPHPARRALANSKVLDAGIYTTNQLDSENLEYLTTDSDLNGEQKIDSFGRLKNGRKYRIHCFNLPKRGKKLFFLATETAKELNFRDSYLLFHKNKSLFKVIATDEEKQFLISNNLIPNAFRSRSIALVTSRSIFVLFGCRIIYQGKRVTDDYWETKARQQGFIEGEPVDRKPIKSTHNTNNLHRDSGPGGSNVGYTNSYDYGTGTGSPKGYEEYGPGHLRHSARNSDFGLTISDRVILNSPMTTGGSSLLNNGLIGGGGIDNHIFVAGKSIRGGFEFLRTGPKYKQLINDLQKSNNNENNISLNEDSIYIDKWNRNLNPGIPRVTPDRIEMLKASSPSSLPKELSYIETIHSAAEFNWFLNANRNLRNEAWKEYYRFETLQDQLQQQQQQQPNNINNINNNIDDSINDESNPIPGVTTAVTISAFHDRKNSKSLSPIITTSGINTGNTGDGSNTGTPKVGHRVLSNTGGGISKKKMKRKGNPNSLFKNNFQFIKPSFV